MENDNDFFRKFDNTGKSNKKSVYTTILTSFVSAIIGAICAVLICMGIYNSNNNGKETVDTATSNSGQSYANLNLSQVSLENYSDTAIYAANKVLPSMVSISVEYDVNYMGMSRTSSGSGSGIIISEDGYILTNNHVVSSSDSSYFYQVSDAKSIKVSIYGDDTEYEAKIVGTDSQTDLAVLKIEKTGLTPAEFGDSSSVQVGEFVLAIGDPYGLKHSVTVVSAAIQDSPYFPTGGKVRR